MTQSPATPLPPPEERRRLREAASLTQAQLAARAGVSKSTVRAWETGRTTPDGRQAEAYAHLLASLEDEPAQQVRQDARPAATTAAVTTAAAATAVRSAGPTADTERLPLADTDPDPHPPPRPEPAAEPLTPAQAFDALYAFCAPGLVRQAYVLTGRRELARESVERAFQLAWQRWPEVAVDRDPAGWVRAAAYEYALSPWHRYRRRHRRPEPPSADVRDRTLMNVILQLPPPYRRTLLLYDGVGLDLPETAAETEATTPATANRLLYARQAVASRLPDLADPAHLQRRLGELAATERLRAARPLAVRTGGERRAQFWTRAAIAFTVTLIGATALTLRTAPTQYEPPVAPGETVRGVPPRAAPGPLSYAQLELRQKLRQASASGPERLIPEAR